MNEYSEVLRFIREEMNTFTDTVATTPLAFEEYRKLQGVIWGLALVEAHIKELEAKLEDDE